MGVLSARNIKNPILPVTRLSLPISESIHTKPLSSSLVPGSLVSMSICKSVYPKTMHLVSKIFSSIHVAISAIYYRNLVREKKTLTAKSSFLLYITKAGEHILQNILQHRCCHFCYKLQTLGQRKENINTHALVFNKTRC